MAKVTITIDMSDKQLAYLKQEALNRFVAWTDDALDKKPKANPYWPTPLEVFAFRILLHELKENQA